MIDFLPLWNASEKEKRTIAFYIDESIDKYQFSENNRYCYSCKFLDKKYIDDFIDEFVEELKIKNIKKNVIEKFFNDLLDYFDNDDEKIEMKTKKLQYIIDFLYTHNKNYTKKQWDCIIELKELVDEGSAEK